MIDMRQDDLEKENEELRAELASMRTALAAALDAIDKWKKARDEYRSKYLMERFINLLYDAIDKA